MGRENTKTIYDRRSDKDRRANQSESFPIRDSKGVVIEENRRVFGDRRKTEGLELSSADIDDDEFAEVFKQFQMIEPDSDESNANGDSPNQVSERLEIIDYKVLYRKGVECAYITLLKINEQEDEPMLFAFREENLNAVSEIESSPLRVQNIFGPDAYESYLEQGWSDISKTENIFPWALKAWLAQNLKQESIESRDKL